MSDRNLRTLFAIVVSAIVFAVVVMAGSLLFGIEDPSFAQVTLILVAGVALVITREVLER